MNITKTNKLGLLLINGVFFPELKNKLRKFKQENELIKKDRIINDVDVREFGKDPTVMVRSTVFDNNKYTKVLRVSKNIMDTSKLINIDSIKDNIDVSMFDFNSLIILLDNDKSGMIKVDRQGTDFDFFYLKGLNEFSSIDKVYFDTYSFLTKEFNLSNGCDGTRFVIQLLAYLYYGEITTRHIISKSTIKIGSFTRITNNTKLNITFVDTLWKQRICVNGFKVSGHFRLQPFGEERKKRKLIWIEEFNKNGYNRRATREIIKL